MNITIIEGADLNHLLDLLGADRPETAGIYAIRVSQDGSGVKFKVNAGMWSPALGSADGGK